MVVSEKVNSLWALYSVSVFNGRAIQLIWVFWTGYIRKQLLQLKTELLQFVVRSYVCHQRAHFEKRSAGRSWGVFLPSPLLWKSKLLYCFFAEGGDKALPALCLLLYTRFFPQTSLFPAHTLGTRSQEFKYAVDSLKDAHDQLMLQFTQINTSVYLIVFVLAYCLKKACMCSNLWRVF